MASEAPLHVDGFASGAVFEQLRNGLTSLPEAQRQKILKQTKGVFELAIRGSGSAVQSWTIDFKTAGGSVYAGKPAGKPDIVISTTDATFLDLASGKINGQKAFMTGKIKVNGNIMLATKLDNVLKVAKKSGGAAPAPAKAAATATGGASASAPAKVAAPTSSGVSVPGFASSGVFEEIAAGIAAAPQATKDKMKRQIKSVFQFDVRDPKTKATQTWYIDMKDSLQVSLTAPGGKKANVTIAVADKDFVDLAQGKLNGQKAFMTGKIKVKGNIMLATKLDTVFKGLRPKAKM